MRWHLYSDQWIYKKLSTGIKKGTFSSTILKTIQKETSKNTKKDSKIILRTDSEKFIKNATNKMISICSKLNFMFDKMSINDTALYKSNRIISDEPMDTNQWYFTLSIISFKTNETAYHFHYTWNKQNYHLILLHEQDIV